MNVTVPVEDERAIEVFASGFLMFHGAQLRVDITLRSATSSDGLATVQRCTRMGQPSSEETEYVDFVVGRCVGGRWRMLAGARAREVLPVLLRSVYLAWRRWWTRMLAVSCTRDFANSLVQPSLDVWSGIDGPTPDLTDLFGEA